MVVVLPASGGFACESPTVSAYLSVMEITLPIRIRPDFGDEMDHTQICYDNMTPRWFGQGCAEADIVFRWSNYERLRAEQLHALRLKTYAIGFTKLVEGGAIEGVVYTPGAKSFHTFEGLFVQIYERILATYPGRAAAFLPDAHASQDDGRLWPQWYLKHTIGELWAWPLESTVLDQTLA